MRKLPERFTWHSPFGGKASHYVTGYVEGWFSTIHIKTLCGKKITSAIGGGYKAHCKKCEQILASMGHSSPKE